MTAALRKQLEAVRQQAVKERLLEANKASAKELLLSINSQVSRMVSSVEKVDRK